MTGNELQLFSDPGSGCIRLCSLRPSSHLHLLFFFSVLPSTSRINHNERLEFLGDAVVEFLTRWDGSGSSLIEANINWSRLQHCQPFFLFSLSSPSPSISMHASLSLSHPFLHTYHLWRSFTGNLTPNLITHLTLAAWNPVTTFNYLPSIPEC